tara:strand:- start:303 stop:473 length:171 start_codon:yes stop_codon:yes gene_type:complete
MSLLDEFELQLKEKEEMEKFLKVINDTKEFILGKYQKPKKVTKPKKKRTYKRRSKK